MSNACFQGSASQERYSGWELHDTFWLLSGLFALAATIMSIHLIGQHYRNYTQPQYQRYIIRILYMVPIYSLTSWLSFRYFAYEVYFDVVRDCYEAFVIYSFFALLINYLGEDEEQQREKLMDKDKRKFPLPLRCWSFDPKSIHFLQNCRLGTLQYVVVRPVTTFISLIALELNIFCPSSLNFHSVRPYMLLANFIAVSVAMYTLVTFYLTVKKDLAPFNPISKFLSVKFVIFFCFWQSIFVSIIGYFGLIHATQYWTVTDVSSGVQNFLVTIEMVIAAIIHYRAFDYTPFVLTDEPKTTWYISCIHTINIWDLCKDCHGGAKHIQRHVTKKIIKVTQTKDPTKPKDITNPQSQEELTNPKNEETV